ncbi:hypothetical protein KAM546c_36670 [Enterobacter roggenkampii]|nr:hypothetical protein KAM546c_03870 [Enterobacter roggenkampii]BDS22406.1 hypothetical protein KAM546c_36670 [Enterobacter roggenkampii]
MAYTEQDQSGCEELDDKTEFGGQRMVIIDKANGGNQQKRQHYPQPQG